jgi:hypothetical protein
VIKFNPNRLSMDPPMKGFSEEKGFTNFNFIKNERRFIDLLPESDVVVIDVPTTTLLQSLTTTKPVFVYTGHLHIDENAFEMLQKRAYCYSDLNEFTKALDNYLLGKNIGEVDLEDTVFLEYYGMHKLNGKAGQRAAQLVKSKIDNRVIEKGRLNNLNTC